ncbi:PREDICTED: membrane-associated progesterone receptor component 1-like [Priapulus caudatus]|uniref:Membrane-associated progesterone receptor component 1-like n=1 Tax=Priapulus caudatus TaxID=37621 RepID=A0ABM1DWM7_PRICU|nr:PREDICTED: membrane-associated progesterone receptor component 1-like [Priapulus caudatus]
MAEPTEQDRSMFVAFLEDIIYSPINLALLAICAFLLYKIIKGRRESVPATPSRPPLPKLKKQDFALHQLNQYNGLGPDERICIAVNGKVFDVTRGRRFYGPGGPYGIFAGHDASRGLATFSVGAEAIKDECDDLSDLTSEQMDSVREWELQFMEKYDYIGKLLRPGEAPSEYSEDDEEPTTAAPATKPKDE